MAKFILFIFILFIAMLVFGIAFLSRFIQSFTRRSPFNKESNGNQYTKQNNNNSERHAHEHQKIFGKDEGEYVDYEEIKKDQN